MLRAMRFPLALLLITASSPAPAQDPSPPQALDAWLDQRWAAAPASTKALLGRFAASGLGVEAVEELLRAGRARYPAPGIRPGAFSQRLYPLRCDHVDYSTQYLLYVPRRYDPKRPSGLLLVAHGGNGAMLLLRAGQAALGGTFPWIREAERHNWIVAAPLTQRGWGQIGNSVVFSLISKLQRDYHIDPDRIYLTGHSMGGHMTWRSALAMPDRWAAVSPMSGGYDFVARNQIANLYGVPGYATWCQTEPYGIGKDNATNAAWLQEHAYPWKMVKAPGRHTIPQREIPKIARFFQATPRDLYRKELYIHRAGRLQHDRAPDAAASKKRNWARTESWQGPHTWVADRPLDFSTNHWIRLTDGEARKEPRVVHGRILGGNRIDLRTKGVSKLRLYLHAKMLEDAEKPVLVTVNGAARPPLRFAPDLKTMLELVREFDDRGRVFHMAVDLEIRSETPELAPPASGDK